MMLQGLDLCCIRGYKELFSNLNFSLNSGEILRIKGANGTGKTSLLRMLSGLALPAAGEVRWQQKPIQHQREDFGKTLIYLGHAASIKDDLSAWENLIFSAALAAHKISKSEAIHALSQMGIAHIAELPVRLLSQGQRKRVALARLYLNTASRLWVLDEPFSALDQDSVQQLGNLLDSHLQNGGVVVYTTHQEVNLQTAARHTLDLNQVAKC